MNKFKKMINLHGEEEEVEEEGETKAEKNLRQVMSKNKRDKENLSINLR